MAKVSHRERCPSCAAKGLDTNGDNLVVYDDGHSYCFSCGYRAGGRSTEKERKVNRKITMPAEAIPCPGIKHRYITSKACATARVLEMGLLSRSTGEVMTRSGKPMTSGVVLFPFYDLKNRLVGIKYRDFYSEEESGVPKDETIWVEGNITLGGLHLVHSKQRSECCIWEGEIDWLTGIQCDANRDHFFIPGSKSTRYIKEYSSLFRKYKRIYVGFDNDEAGDDARDAIKDILPMHRLYFIEYGQYNDVNEAFMAEGRDIYNTLIETAYQDVAEDIITGDELVESFFDYFAAVSKIEYISTGIDSLDAMLGGGLTPGEVLGLVGHTGCGKTSLCATVAINTIEDGVRSFWGGTEMQYGATMRRQIEMITGKTLRKKFGVEEWTISDEEIEDAVSQISDSMVFYRQALQYDWQRFEDSLLASIYQHDVRVVFIDVLNDVLSTDWATNEHIMQRLNAIAAGDQEDNRPPVSIVCVMHTRTVQGQSAQKVTLDSIAGGKCVKQKATCIVSITGNVQGSRRKLEVMKKSRMNDSEVMKGIVYLNPETKRYEDFEEPEGEEEETAQDEVRTGENASVATRYGGGIRTRRKRFDAGQAGLRQF